MYKKMRPQVSPRPHPITLVAWEVKLGENVGEPCSRAKARVATSDGGMCRRVRSKCNRTLDAIGGPGRGADTLRYATDRRGNRNTSTDRGIGRGGDSTSRRDTSRSSSRGLVGLASGKTRADCQGGRGLSRGRKRGNCSSRDGRCRDRSQDKRLHALAPLRAAVKEMQYGTKLVSGAR